MEGRGKSRRRKPRREWKQRLSSVTAVILVLSMVLNMPSSWAWNSIANVYAASSSDAKRNGEGTVWATASNAKYKEGKTQDVDIYVIAEDNEVVPGNMSSMTLYLRNNTDEAITSGVLKFKSDYIEKENGFFTNYNEDDIEGEPSVIISQSGENGGTTSGEGLLYQEVTPENSLETGTEEFGQETEGSKMQNQDDAELEASEWEEEFGSQDDEDEEEEQYVLTDIDLEPGELYPIQFDFYTEDDEEPSKAYVRFSFEGEGVDSEKKIRSEEKFYYSINLPYVNVELTDGTALETGVTHEMNIWMTEPAWGDFEEDAEVEINLDLSTSVDEEEDDEELASASDAEKATDSEARKKTTSSTEESSAEITEEEKEKILQYAENAMAIRESRVSYDVTIYGVSYKKFRPQKAEAVENVGWISCLYEFANEAQPGIYYGKVMASGKWNKEPFTTEQGYLFEVTGEGQITLEGSLGETIVEVTGPTSSFPEAEALQVQVSEIDEDQRDQVNQALEKKSREEGLAVSSYKALDIKLIADGEETEPVGPISVSFKNLKLEETAEAISDEVAPLAESPAAETSVEDVTGEIRVFHLDEEETAANEMVSTTEENGTVVMETDHFSVYIIAATGEGSIAITVEHYATIKAIKDNAGLVADGRNSTAHVDYVEKEVEIYSPDELTLMQLRKYTPEELSKLCGYSSDENAIKNYKAISVEIYDSTGKKIGEADLDNNASFYLNTGDTVKIIYEPVIKDDGMRQSVVFYDYNVTDGNLYKKNGWRGGYQVSQGSEARYVLTYNAGINTATGIRNENSTRLAVGQYETPVFHTYSTTFNKFNKQPTTGLVTNVNDNGPVYSGNIWDNNLFNKTPITGKSVITDYELKFKQIGDTYILKDVVNDNSSVMCEGSKGNLDVIRYILDSPANGNLNGKIYGNNFWPLDNYSERQDPLFGGSTKYWAINGTGNNARTQEVWGSDDGKAHNWYFGMRYDFEFQLGDYVGPLNYYFLGDDDFWLFVDGSIEHGADLGGIHSSQGTTVNLSYLLEEVQKAQAEVENAVTEEAKAAAQEKVEELKNKKHKMTIIYAERGGQGSCCYMQFTLPNVNPIIFDTEETTSVTVEKEWENDTEADRPAGISVQLSYKKDGDTDYIVYDTKNLTANSWSYTWDDLPAEGYTYKIKEVTVPDGYKVSYTDDGTAVKQSDGSYKTTITNTYVMTSLAIEKIWKDSVNTSVRPNEVKMQIYWKTAGATDWEPYTATDPKGMFTNGIVTLNSSNTVSSGSSTWKVVLNNLPASKEVDGKEVAVEYTVRELNGTTAIEDKGYLPANDGNDSYQVSYTTTPAASDGTTVCTVKVTNTLASKLTITKIRANSETKLSGVGFTLYKAVENAGQSGETTGFTKGNLVDTYTTDKGLLTLTGLYPESGTYLLEETSPLPGYHKPNPWLIQVDSNGTVTMFEASVSADGTVFSKGTAMNVDTDTDTKCYTVTIANQTGAALPETGGPGVGLIKEYGWMLVLLSLLMAGIEIPIYGIGKRRREE